MQQDITTPLVTIRCLTYNHEPYIRQCLEGFVMQKTSFKFEAIVHDDASTDGTANIVREFAEKYPDIIKPIFQTENQYSKGIGEIRRVMNAQTRGKYIALCEGDDYWTDPLKLQKQVDFLEKNPDVTITFHNAIEHSQDGEFEDRIWRNLEEREYSSDEIWEAWTIPTASVVFRREILDTPVYQKVIVNKKFIYGDICLFLTAAEYGKVYCLSNLPMSVYRKHKGGVTSMRNTDITPVATHRLQFRGVFSKLSNACLKRMEMPAYYGLFRDNLRNRKLFAAYTLMVKMMKLSPILTLRAINKTVNNKLQR